MLTCVLWPDVIPVWSLRLGTYGFLCQCHSAFVKCRSVTLSPEGSPICSDWYSLLREGGTARGGGEGEMSHHRVSGKAGDGNFFLFVWWIMFPSSPLQTGLSTRDFPVNWFQGVSRLLDCPWMQHSAGEECTARQRSEKKTSCAVYKYVSPTSSSL